MSCLKLLPVLIVFMLLQPAYANDVEDQMEFFERQQEIQDRQIDEYEYRERKYEVDKRLIELEDE